MNNDIPKEIERFDLSARIQHVIMFTTFLLLSFTGWGLKYAYQDPASAWIRFWGGAKSAGIIHRVAGITMLLDFVYHQFYLINRARSFIFSTSLPPAVMAASIAAFDLVDSPEGRELRERLARNVRLFKDGLQSGGFNTMGSETQIVPVFVGEAEQTMEFSRLLLEQGIFVQGIRPPTVPAGSCRLRCTIMATHGADDLERAVAAIVNVGKMLGII